MNRALVRFARRRANWEDPNLTTAELQEREFKARNGGPDLRPSVYETDNFEQRLVQTYAEHSHRIDPPRTALAFDVSAAVPGELLPTPGDSPFEYTRRQHREVVLRSHQELLSFIDATRTTPRRGVSKREVEAYVQRQLANSDTEWTRVASQPNAKTWIRKLAAKRD